jgi:hypothetical protein
MKRIVVQLRLLLAETLLGWIITLAPKDHPDGMRLIQAVHDYLKKW